MRWYRAPRGQIPAARGAAGPGKQPRALPGAPRVSLLKGQPRGRKERKRCISPPQNSKSQSFRSTQVSYLPAARGVSEGSSVRGRSGPTWSLQPTARGSSSPLPSPQTPLTRAAPSHSPEDDGSAPSTAPDDPTGMAQTYGAHGDLGCGCGLAGRSSSGRALVSRSAKPHPSPHLPPAEEERPQAASAPCQELGEPTRLGKGLPALLWGSGQPRPPPGPGIPRGYRLRPIQPPSPSSTPQPQVRAAPPGLLPGPRTPQIPLGIHRLGPTASPEP